MATSPPFMQTRPSTDAATQAAASPAAARTLFLPCLLPALVTGGLLWACFQPLALGAAAWVALVPLLCLVRSDRQPRKIYFAAYAGGLVFFLTTLQWMRYADYRMYATWIALGAYCALYFPAAVYLTRALERRTRLPLIITFPAVWIGLEYVRSFALTGFAWFYLGHSQHEFLTLIQVTDLGGVYAVSLLVAAVNALLFDLIYQLESVRAFLHLHPPAANRHTFGDDWPELSELFFVSWRRGILIDAFVVGLLLGAAYLYGGWRLDQSAGRSGPVIALLQGNLDQRIRNDTEPLPADANAAAAARLERYQQAVLTVGDHYGALVKLADRCGDPRPDLFVWPETSDPFGWTVTARDLPINRVPAWWRDAEQMNRERFRDFARRYKMPQLLGIGTRFLDAEGKERSYNSALMVDAAGVPGDRYDKMHRVPFGEYVPLRDWLPFMNWFAPYDYDYSVRQGESFTRFSLDRYRFGVLVCYEDSDPFLARRYARPDGEEPQADFLVNMSNEGWFDGSCEHAEHLAVSRFRAIECRRALVRAVNMGISAVIDGNGRVLKPERVNTGEGLPVWAVRPGFDGKAPSLPQAEWRQFQKVAGVLVAAVPIDGRTSLYAMLDEWMLSDWLPMLGWVLIGIGTLGAWTYRQLRPAGGA